MQCNTADQQRAVLLFVFHHNDTSRERIQTIQLHSQTSIINVLTLSVGQGFFITFDAFTIKLHHILMKLQQQAAVTFKCQQMLLPSENSLHPDLTLSLIHI